MNSIQKKLCPTIYFTKECRKFFDVSKIFDTFLIALTIAEYLFILKIPEQI
jgi:hypothetical protein